MSSALNRAEHYRELAQECRRLAATTLSNRMKNRYSWMAEIYAALAEADVRRRTTLERNSPDRTGPRVAEASCAAGRARPGGKLGRLAAPQALAEKRSRQTEARDFFRTLRGGVSRIRPAH